jgi:uncharacterized protein (TIGR00297 family)
MEFTFSSHPLFESLLVNGIIAGIAYYTKTVRRSGVIGGLIVGIPIYFFLGYHGFLILFSMFILGTLATKVGYKTKQEKGIAEEAEGARGFKNAIAKCLPGVFFAAGVWFGDWDSGTFARLMGLAFVASFATGAFDTVSSELGQVYGKRAFTLIPIRRVNPGTEGAVSLEGTVAGLIAAVLIIFLGYGMHLLGDKKAILIAIISAFISNLVESMLGSQFEHRQLLGKFESNLIMTILGGILAIFLFKII